MKCARLIALGLFVIGDLFAGDLLVGPGAGVVSQLGQFDESRGVLYDAGRFLPFDSSSTGGVRVASGDVNGDGIADLFAGAGPGGYAQVKIFSGADQEVVLHDFLAFGNSFSGGVFVATGDVNGDGKSDVVVAADSGGGPSVRVFRGDTGAELHSFFAYASDFTGGVRVAAADVNGDGKADIITGAGSGNGQVKVFSGEDLSVLAGFLPFGGNYNGGVFVAAGDLDGNGSAEVVVGRDSGGPTVSVFSGTGTLINSFSAYAADFTGGVRVAVADVDGDGSRDILTGPGTGGSQVGVFNGTAFGLKSAVNVSPDYTNGVYVGGRVSGSARVAKPVFTPPSGDYKVAFQLYISCATPDAQIHYTLDGTAPNGSSPVFSDLTPIAIEADKIVRAVAMADDRVDSAEAIGSFTLISGPVLDAGPPALILDTPTRVVTKKKAVLISGRTDGPYGVTKVEYRFTGDKNWKIASGTKKWSARVVVKDRSTTVELRAIGGDGQISRVEKVAIKFKKPKR